MPFDISPHKHLVHAQPRLQVMVAAGEPLLVAPMMKPNPDGSLTIYVQQTSPGKDKEADWLPAPKGDFSLYLRAYWPKTEIVDGSWLPPAVVEQ